MKRYPAITVLLAGLIVSAMASAGALHLPRQPKLQADGFTPKSAQEESLQDNSMNAQQAAREAQQRNGGGRVLSVDEAGDGWRVKLLKDGNVRIVFVAN